MIGMTENPEFKDEYSEAKREKIKAELPAEGIELEGLETWTWIMVSTPSEER
ncbi:hypothetical protein [Natronococcus wangiae]|uniref:hypothetical protein n=1 Tax=Natronococcus wangiae TaxID=3068275 RepID=UPI00273F0519|nr:hypothetical protein [Natronococcus sp. AD5]